MTYNTQVDILEPVNFSEHLDKIELYLGQVCQIAGISKMQLDYWTNKAQIPTKGKLAGARIVRQGYQVMLISTGGTVIRIPVEEIKRLGRSTQGVIVMRLRGDEEKVSSLALVMEGADSDTAVGEAADAAVEAGIEPLAEPDFDEDGFPAASDDDES